VGVFENGHKCTAAVRQNLALRTVSLALDFIEESQIIGICEAYLFAAFSSKPGFQKLYGLLHSPAPAKELPELISDRISRLRSSNVDGYLEFAYSKSRRRLRVLWYAGTAFVFKIP
jgi:hypothetical protein